MADITDIFGGGFTRPEKQQTIIARPEEQLIAAIADAGLTPPDSISMDGQIHRFNAGTKGSGGHGDKTGWYVCFSDGIPAGRFGCWRAGIEVTFRAETDRQLTAIDEMAFAQRMAEAKAKRDEARKKQNETAANTVAQIWAQCTPASPSHPYLTNKQIQPHGARVTGDGRLVVPLYDAKGHLSSLQYIDSEGGKLYHSGAKTGGAYWCVGSTPEIGAIYIAEGFATAATIYATTDRPCYVAYSASNLVPVTSTLREQLGPQQELIIVADNDASGVGQKYADQASAKYGCKIIIPPIPGDANDYANQGHDLHALLNPPIDQWLIPADEFCEQPAPLKWLLKHWLPATGLIMIHGPSGGGKTFVALDWCLAIASSQSERMGHKVRGGTVVYLAGEGHHGLKGRLAVWKQHNDISSVDMYLSKDGCDLNTSKGYMRVLDSIRALQKKPALIAVDTLHRFLDGDENSAVDTKTMLDACGGLITEFDCAVVLVHHTGVNQETQHRARGSSAWRGALDVEISIVPGQNDNPIEIIQRKNKDAEAAETMYCRLESTPIEGWIDEDGEPVTSAIVQQVDESEKKTDKKPSKLDKFMKLMERAYWQGGAQIVDDKPYISKSSFIELLKIDQYKEGTIKNYIKASYENGPIFNLVNAEMIENSSEGWFIIDRNIAQALMIARSNNDH